mgnify:FL=1
MAKKNISTTDLIDKLVDEKTERQVTEILKDLPNDFDDDPEYIPGISSRSREVRKDTQDRLVDDLIADIPKNDDFYIKLYKEIKPNEFEFKEKLDNWMTWTDVECEITNIVREYTIKYPGRWGSGKYRIIFFRSKGNRGPRLKPPIDFFIDAMEIIDAKGNTINPMYNPESIINAVKSAIPTYSPDNLQKLITDTQNSTISLMTEKMKTESSSSNTMVAALMSSMTMMMTEMMKMNAYRPDKIELPPPVDANKVMEGMLTTMRAFGILDKKEKSLIENIKELESAGLWHKPTDTKELNAFDKFKELKDMLDLVKDFSGDIKGERMSLTERLIDTLGPKIPEMIARITSTIDNAAKVRSINTTTAHTNIPTTRTGIPAIPAQMPLFTNENAPDLTNDPSHTSTSSHTIPHTATHNPPYNAAHAPENLIVTNANGGLDMNEVKKLTNTLHNLIVTNDTQAFPEIKHVIETEFSKYNIIENIKTGTYNVDAIMFYVENFNVTDDPRFKDPQFIAQTRTYLQTFIDWLKNNQEFIAICDKCNMTYEYYDENEFFAETDKHCLENENGQTCQGILYPAQSEAMTTH